MRSAVACGVAVGAFMALGASGAMAQEGVFSTTGPVIQSGSLTFEIDGGSPIECPDLEISGESWGTLVASLGWHSYDCDGAGGLGLFGVGVFTYPFFDPYSTDGTPYYVELATSGGISPHGAYEGGFGAHGDVVNAAGGQPTTMTFNDAVLGYTENGHSEISITGTLELRDQYGGDVTVE